MTIRRDYDRAALASALRDLADLVDAGGSRAMVENEMLRLCDLRRASTVPVAAPILPPPLKSQISNPPPSTPPEAEPGAASALGAPPAPAASPGPSPLSHSSPSAVPPSPVPVAVPPDSAVLRVLRASAVPPELAALPLYAADPRLCRAWPELKAALAQAWPRIDLKSQIARSHGWLIAHPKRRSGRPDYLHFIWGWMRGAEDDPKFRAARSPDQAALDAKSDRAAGGLRRRTRDAAPHLSATDELKRDLYKRVLESLKTPSAKPEPESPPSSASSAPLR